jgi:hypothetical protein
VVDNTFHSLNLHSHSLSEVHVLLHFERLELVDLVEYAAGFHGARTLHNDQAQKLLVSDKSMVAASSSTEQEAKALQNEDAVVYQDLRQKLFPVAGLRSRRSRLVVDTCQRIAIRVALSCNDPQVVEKADGYTDHIGGVDFVDRRDCCMTSNVVERTRTGHLSG